MVVIKRDEGSYCEKTREDYSVNIVFSVIGIFTGTEGHSDVQATNQESSCEVSDVNT